MNEKKLKNLPLGESTFRDIINKDKLYVDKTEEIYKLLETQGKYFFLSRPRRFGKSLLLSTFEEIFLGNKELFNGLYIYDKIDFKKYPVIKLTMNDLTYSEGLSEFKNSLLYHLKNIYEKYDLKLETDNYILAFKNLIRELSKKSEQEKVVLLIDEYDKPIIEYLGSDIKKSKEMRDILKNFYETIKANDEYIHFAFLTGVSKFSKISIFSTLNNLTDITMDENHSKIVGIDEEQLYSYFDERIKILAKKLDAQESEVKSVLRDWYNGYSWDGKNFLYNPYAILSVFNFNKIKNYWFESGTPTLLLNIIKDYNIDIKKIDNCVLNEKDFSTYEIDNINIYSILFQTGYLTIKKVEKLSISKENFYLSYPNVEVKESFLLFLLDSFAKDNPSNGISIDRLVNSLENKNIDDFFTILTALFATIPNQINASKKTTIENKELYYHTIFHLIFTLIGVNIKSEVSVNTGRVDSVVETNDSVYIFEFKIESKNNNESVDNAIKQIKEKKYADRYLATKKEIFIIGASFDTEKRNISQWKFEILN
jgi:hypothetical protein